MSTTRGIRTLAGVALAASVVLLGGCSTSGTVGGSAAAAGGSSTGGSASGGSASGGSASGGSATGGSSSSSSSSDSSGTSGTTGGVSAGALSSDPGCQAALTAESTIGSSTNLTDPNSGKTALQQLSGKMHTAAGQSKNPAAAAAINKLGDDYATFANQLGSGAVPDTTALETDTTAMTTACISG